MIINNINNNNNKKGTNEERNKDLKVSTVHDRNCIA